MENSSIPYSWGRQQVEIYAFFEIDGRNRRDFGIAGFYISIVLNHPPSEMITEYIFLKMTGAGHYGCVWIAKDAPGRFGVIKYLDENGNLRSNIARSR